MPLGLTRWAGAAGPTMLAFTRYCFILQSFILGVNHAFIAIPTCKAYPIAVLLHDHCAIYARPLTSPLLCHTLHDIGDGNIM